MSRHTTIQHTSYETFICISCGILKMNRIGPDDCERALLTLAARPLTRLPFPLEVLCHD